MAHDREEPEEKEEAATEKHEAASDDFAGGNLLGDLEELVERIGESQEEPAAAAPEPAGVAGVTPEAPEIPPAVRTELERLQRKLAEKEAQLSQVVEAYRKLKQDSEGFRGRIEQNQRRLFERSKNDFISRFVEVLDNLDRAIDAIETSFDSDSVLQGIILVRSRLVQLLREEGLEKIFVGGLPFDPAHSEAAGLEPVEDASRDNLVVKELQRGYMLKGKLLRPARVLVGRYQGAAPEEIPDPDQAES